MSERTTIGGTVYEAIGSSSANLLLKCNGTARIQWGNKLIDLIKNGKIASEDSLELLFIVNNESEIKSDGIYVLTTEESSKLIIYKDNNKYDFTESDLYISASKEQNLTVEQKKQALDNIGMYYNTLEEVLQAKIQTGIVYVTDTETLYTIKNGVIKEFEAKLKTVTVENNENDVINSSVKIVLSILDEEYLVLADLRITANYSIHVKNSAQIGSESADKTQGYRLYIEGNTSYLDVDEINVRNGITVKQFNEVTFEQLDLHIKNKTLEPHRWYLIKDFLNHWKLPIYDEKFNRPILVRALTTDSLYEKGYLFKNHNIEIKYDPTYLEVITLRRDLEGQTTYEDIVTRGRITWMKDNNNNEANFDFLDYIDAEKLELTTLHYPTNNENLDKSIFPKYSYNNKLIIYNLKGTIIKNKVIDNTNTTIIDFQFNDSGDNSMKMFNNYIECKELILGPECLEFCNNTLKKSINIFINNYFCNNIFSTIYNTNSSIIFEEVENLSDFNLVQFLNKVDNVICSEYINSLFYNKVINCSFGKVNNCVFNSELENVNFKNLSNCNLETGVLNDIISYCDLKDITLNNLSHRLLYNTSKRKEIYLKENSELEIVCIPDVIFYRGMIIMHSGIEEIPKGWAICDGGTYEFEGISSTTPNLTDKFIKAVSNVNEIGEVLNDQLNNKNELLLKKELLPKHQHEIDTNKFPLYTTDEITGYTSRYDPLSLFVTTTSGTLSVGVSVSVSVSVSVEGSSDSDYDSSSDSDSITLDGITLNYLGTGANYETVNHYHKIDWGERYILTENNDKDVEQLPIKLEPNYYSLIFIMKL